ncbi:DUF2625 family protein [Streptomyces sp. CL7]|uniref:DUF2625 family protein n=1 Tax=Streptomyces sp. CL7 TaxID=3096006 RepID=UPI002A750AF8|nr:DUF2625 family protein [Streptomyces sp. CL7]WPP32456.1 DUF2625 family protein [Streptomyces sp. CL7]
MREVDQLLNVGDPAWPLLLQELSSTDVPVEVLPGDAEAGRASLLQLQVSARLGSVRPVRQTGRRTRGMSLDKVWNSVNDLYAAADVLDADAGARRRGAAGRARPGHVTPSRWAEPTPNSTVRTGSPS